MGINNILLSAEMLPAFYSGSLVIYPETSRIPGTTGEKQAREPEQKSGSKTGNKTVSQPEKAYRFLGNNQRRISFIVSYPGAVFLPDEQLAFLTRMLAACHCSIADISVLNMAHTPVDIKKIISQLHPEMLFLCGISPGDLHLPGPEEHFSIAQFNGVTTIFIPSLTILSQEETPDLIPIKKKLWTSLKILFNIQN